MILFFQKNERQVNQYPTFGGMLILVDIVCVCASGYVLYISVLVMILIDDLH